MGDFVEDETIIVPWDSFDGMGGSITITGFIAADVIIFKDGNVAQKTTTNGITVAVDFDSGRTGLHLVTIDTAIDTGDVGFWVPGSDYQVAIDAVTIDGETVRFWLCIFSIENRNVIRTSIQMPELLQGIPGATPTPEEALMLFYMAMRNKFDITATFKEIHNNAGVVITKKALSDDTTTYSEAQAESGP
jgi:hypothetical protein